MAYQNRLSSFLFKYNFVHKFQYKNSNKLPEIDRIVLNFGCRTNESSKLASNLVALKLLGDLNASLTVSKKPHIFFTIKRGSPSGCKLVLKGSPKGLFFLRRIFKFILPRIKTFSGFDLKKNIQDKSFFFKIKDCFVFPEIERGYPFFWSLAELDIRVVFKNVNKSNELKHTLLMIPSLLVTD